MMNLPNKMAIFPGIRRIEQKMVTDGQFSTIMIAGGNNTKNVVDFLTV